MRYVRRMVLVVCAACMLVGSSGCVLTKLLTVPMRVVGGVVSIIPVAGNTVHDAIDESAEVIDDIPL